MNWTVGVPVGAVAERTRHYLEQGHNSKLTRLCDLSPHL